METEITEQARAHNWTPDEVEAWLRDRRSCIGSSDAPAIMGVSPYSDPLKVYSQKLGLLEAEPMSDVMKLGLLMEPALATLHAEKTGRDVIPPPDRLIRHPERDWQGASIDRLQYDRELGWGLLELKTTRYFDIESELPEYWQVQVQHQFDVARSLLEEMGCSKLWGSISILERTSGRFFSMDVEPHLPFIDQMVIEEEAFWKRVIAQDPPEPTPKTDRRVLQALHPEDDGSEVSLPSSVVQWADQWEESDREVKRWSAMKAEAQSMICAAIGDAQIGRTSDGRRFSWKLQERAAHEVRASRFRKFQPLRRRAQ